MDTNNYIKFGYCYDFTLLKLMGGTYGSHEVYLIYNLADCLSLKNKRRKHYNPNRECWEMEFNPDGLFLHH